MNCAIDVDALIDTGLIKEEIMPSCSVNYSSAGKFCGTNMQETFQNIWTS